MLAVVCFGERLHGQAASADTTGFVLDFQEAELRTVITTLAELAGITIVHTGLPNQLVTLRTAGPVSQADLGALFRGVATANGLSLIEENGLVRVFAESAPGGGPAARLAAPFESQPVRLFVYRLQHAEAEDVANTLRAVFGLAERPTSMSPGEPGALSEQLRRQLVPPVGTPQPGFPPQPQPGLTGTLHAQAQIVPDAATNALLIRGSSEDFEILRAAIQELDQRPLQVIIEVLIVEIRRDRQLDLGFDFTVADQQVGDGGVRIGGDIKGPSPGDIELRILGAGGIQADILIRALAASSNVTILSRPVVMAQNNQEARILVGAQRPFVQVSRSLPTDGAVRDQVVQYRDVGTRLRIRPTINADGFVRLKVLQEVSSATTETQFGAPIISTREVETQLLVPDGRTVVLGGLIDQVRENSRSGIPFLQDIPLLGALFRSSHSRRGVTELFLFITPRVLRTDEDLLEATRRLEEGTRLLRRTARDPSLVGDETPAIHVDDDEVER